MSEYKSLPHEDEKETPSALLHILDVFEVARLLHAHPETIRVKARTGEIPARKVGKGWIFSIVALQHYLEGQLPSRVVQGDTTNEGEICRSTNVKKVQITTTKFTAQELEKHYKEALAPQKKLKRKSSTTA